MARGSNFVGKHPHNWKGGRTVTKAGYVLIFVGKNHPIADVRGYAYEHRLKAWSAGHNIEGKHVHHENEIRDQNDERNLELLTPAEHRFKHRKAGSNRRSPGEVNSMIYCACGCGETQLKYDSHGQPRRYIFGHNNGGRLEKGHPYLGRRQRIVENNKNP